MRAVAILSTFLCMVSARPELGIGYQYETPIDTYVGTAPDELTYYHEAQQQSEQQYVDSGPYQLYNEEQQYFETPFESEPAAEELQQQEKQADTEDHQENTDVPPVSTDNKPEDQQPIVTRSFYVHAAPEEPEEVQEPTYVHVGRPQKNYKVIFIKAPSYSRSSKIIPVIAPKEEKTIVYVLTKKPNFNQTISVPTAPVTEPSKPEVFFIKYKTEKDAKTAQEKIQAAYDAKNESHNGGDDIVFPNAIPSLGNTDGSDLESVPEENENTNSLGVQNIDEDFRLLGESQSNALDLAQIPQEENISSIYLPIR